MALKRWLAAVLAVLALLCPLAAAGGGGTSSDPVATLGYIENNFLPRFRENLSAAADGMDGELKTISAEASARLSEIAKRDVSTSGESLAAAVEYEGVMRALDGGLWQTALEPTTVVLGAGEQILADAGAELMLISGGANFSGERAGGAVCASNGLVYYGGLAARAGERYIVVGEGAATGMLASVGATVLVSGRYQVVPAVATRHTDAALALKSLGLMRGTDKGLELERGATRLEALIMFLRLIGEEEDALAYDGAQPFTDLPVWGGGAPAKYVGYAYSKGYTNGVSAAKFGANEPITLEMYLTFILRALGYSEAAGDFDWTTAPSDAARLGVISEYEHASAARRPFCRDTMAYLSWRALEAKGADGRTLSARLVSAGAFSESDYSAAKSAGVRALG